MAYFASSRSNSHRNTIIRSSVIKLFDTNSQEKARNSKAVASPSLSKGESHDGDLNRTDSLKGSVDLVSPSKSPFRRAKVHLSFFKRQDSRVVNNFDIESSFEEGQKESDSEKSIDTNISKKNSLKQRPTMFGNLSANPRNSTNMFRGSLLINHGHSKEITVTSLMEYDDMSPDELVEVK